MALERAENKTTENNAATVDRCARMLIMVSGVAVCFAGQAPSGADRKNPMDPNACFEILTNAINSSDRDGAIEAAENLAEWMKGGGFMPLPDEEEEPEPEPEAKKIPTVAWEVSVREGKQWWTRVGVVVNDSDAMRVEIPGQKTIVLR